MIVFHIDKIVVNDEFLVPEAIAIAEPLMLSDLNKCYWTKFFCYQLLSFISNTPKKDHSEKGVCLFSSSKMTKLLYKKLTQPLSGPENSYHYRIFFD